MPFKMLDRQIWKESRWLNNPLSPMEASSTSGMKAALNGVPHLSIMDEWWVEGFNENNGRVFGQKEVSGSRD